MNEQWLGFMSSGAFERAWQVSDAAQLLRREIDCTHWPRHEQFIWNGAQLKGRHVLVRCYHGLGDTVQFMRFLPALRQSAREVTLWLQPTLIPLTPFIEGADRVLPLHDGIPDVHYEVDIEISELMHALRVTPASVADSVPYIKLRSPAVKEHRSRSRIGIVWSSGDWDTGRSISCEKLARLGALSSIEWWVLQRGPALREWRHPFGSIPDIKNILDEARILLELDGLVTVDTCSAHLGGALGIPTCTLLQHEADWRWMRDREDSPWYPSMRLVRQKRAGDWDCVLAKVEAWASCLRSPSKCSEEGASHAGTGQLGSPHHRLGIGYTAGGVDCRGRAGQILGPADARGGPLE